MPKETEPDFEVLFEEDYMELGEAISYYAGIVKVLTKIRMSIRTEGVRQVYHVAIYDNDKPGLLDSGTFKF